LPSGGCAELTETHCASEGGSWAGPGTDCALSEADCSAALGDYRGDGTSCATPDACVLPLVPFFREHSPTWPPAILWREAVGFIGPTAPHVDEEPAPVGTRLVFYRIGSRRTPVPGMTGWTLLVSRDPGGRARLEWR
jgi:hypothetical protein